MSPTAARILIDVGDASQFPTAAHLAAYAGLAPATRSSGSSIRGEHPARRGNKQLKRAFFLAAFASLHHPPSRAYYAKKTAQGKRHTQALLCLARRRCDVLHAMLKNTHHPHPLDPTHRGTPDEDLRCEGGVLARKRAARTGRGTCEGTCSRVLTQDEQELLVPYIISGTGGHVSV